MNDQIKLAELYRLHQRVMRLGHYSFDEKDGYTVRDHGRIRTYFQSYSSDKDGCRDGYRRGFEFDGTLYVIQKCEMFHAAHLKCTVCPAAYTWVGEPPSPATLVKLRLYI